MYESSSMEDFLKGRSRLACKDAEYDTARTMARSHCSNGTAVGVKIYNAGTGKLAGVVYNDGNGVKTYNVIENEGFTETLKGYCESISKILLRHNYLRDVRNHIVTICDNDGKVEVWRDDTVVIKDALTEKGIEDLTDAIITLINHINEAGHPVHSITYPTHIFKEHVMWELSKVEKGAVNIVVQYF